MLAELHVHTKYSKCSANEPLEVIKRTANLDCVAVTDHNSFEGYKAVRKINKRKDLTIIPACEYKSLEGDILGYYVNEDIPRNTPAVEVIERIHEQGGIVCIPHAFDLIRREALGRSELDKIIRKVDLIEGINGRTWFYFNRKARDYALSHDKPIIGGSDAHYPSEIGRVLTEFDDLRKPIKIHSNIIPFVWFFFGARSKARKML